MLNSQLKSLFNNCKSELLNHTLQTEVVSQHIKNVSSCLDECISILNEDSTTDIKRIRSSNFSNSKKDNVLFFSYCMSKWDYPFMNSVSGTSMNQQETFNFLAHKLDTKANTIKNYRDTFDSHISQKRSNRQGWKKPLNDEFKITINKYDDCSEAELINIAKDLL